MTRLYDYQKKCVEKAQAGLKQNGFFALFLDMGLGKTLISLYIANNFFRQKLIDSLIILCPKTIMSIWEEQIRQHLNIFAVQLLFWSKKHKTKKFQKNFSYKMKRPGLKIFIINIEAFQRKNEILTKCLSAHQAGSSIVAIDESSKIKTHNAKQTKRITNIFCNWRYKLILTGTEITNSVLDLYSQFKFLNYYFWKMKNYYIFRARYAILKDKYAPGGRTFKAVVGFQKMDELQNRINPHLVRLKKEDCLDLPDKTIQMIPLKMSSEMRKVYDELKEKLRSQYRNTELTVMNKISLFTRFRQISGGMFPDSENREESESFADNQKLQFLIDELEDVDPAQKIIIWCSFVNEIFLIQKTLKKHFGSDSTIIYYGGVEQDVRQNKINTFKCNSDARFLIINTQTGAFGLNLQFASLAYYYNLPLSIEQYWQSLDRIYRIGQTQKVLYKILQYKKSVDIRIFNLLQTKTKIKDDFAQGTIDDFFEII